MKKVLLQGNSEIVIYNFRLELVERLLTDGFEVFVSFPNISGELGQKKIDHLVQLGCKYEPIEINRHGLNPIEEIKLYRSYKKLYKRVNPDIIFSYTIKPNIYGAQAAKKEKIPFVANITGLGSAVERPGIMQKIIIQMYKIAFSEIQTVFFQNKENCQFFVENNIVIGKQKLLPGSGVNLDHFYLQEYPSTDDTVEFVFISRIMKEKGIDQYLEASKYITKVYPNTRFHVCGFCEEEYEEKLKEYEAGGLIQYHGMINDIREILKNSHCTIHPTYYPEGLSNVLLESAASGRPIITTDRSGTRETINNGINGFLVKEKDTNDLIKAIDTFINLPFNKKKDMGLWGRKKVKEEFNRQIVVDKYIDEINIGVSEDKWTIRS